MHPHDIDRFELLLIQEPVRLAGSQRQLVEKWKAEKRAVWLRRGEDVVAKLKGRINPLVSLASDNDVWLFPRKKPGKTNVPVICHPANSKYDTQSNRTVLQKNVKVRLGDAMLGSSPVKRVTFFTIGKEASEIDYAVDEHSIYVTVLDINLWGILQMGI